MKSSIIVLLLSSLVLTWCFEKKEAEISEWESNAIQTEIQEDSGLQTEITKSELEKGIVEIEEIQEKNKDAAIIEESSTNTVSTSIEEPVITPLSENKTTEKTEPTPTSVPKKNESAVVETEAPKTEPTEEKAPTTSISSQTTSSSNVSAEDSTNIDDILDDLVKIIWDVEDLSNE